MARLTRQLLLTATLFIASISISTGAQAKKRLGKKTPVITASQPVKAIGPRYAEREDAMLAAVEIAQRNQLDAKWVREAIGQAQRSEQIIKLMQPAPVGTAKNWRVYRSRFIDPLRIKAGVKFWQSNRVALAQAQKQMGVPAEIIVGIIGVETIFGQQTGSFRVMDALATLAFDFPTTHPRARERSEFFKGELEQLLLLASRTGADPLHLRGSYAGAMGMPQFMPSSWMRYGIDFDQDGRVDLFHSSADVIGSIANYFVAFKWQPGMPTHYSVRFDADTLDKVGLLAPDILPTFPVADFQAKGALLDGKGLTHTGPLALVELQNGDEAPSYVAGTENFYAITRYNWSSYYAMAVIELGQAIAAALTAETAKLKAP